MHTSTYTCTQKYILYFMHMNHDFKQPHYIFYQENYKYNH